MNFYMFYKLKFSLSGVTGGVYKFSVIKSLIINGHSSSKLTI